MTCKDIKREKICPSRDRYMIEIEQAQTRASLAATVKGNTGTYSHAPLFYRVVLLRYICTIECDQGGVVLKCFTCLGKEGAQSLYHPKILCNHLGKREPSVTGSCMPALGHRISLLYC